MSSRRDFITLLGGAAAWPPAARAQQGGKLPTIGFLGAGAGSDSVWKAWTAAFVQRLGELGWIEPLRSSTAGGRDAPSAMSTSQRSLSGSRSMSLSRLAPPWWRPRSPSRLASLSQPASWCDLFSEQGSRSSTATGPACVRRCRRVRADIISDLRLDERARPQDEHAGSLQRLARVARGGGADRPCPNSWTALDMAGDGLGLPRRQIEIIGEIGRWPILPILQTMFEGPKDPVEHRSRRRILGNCFSALPYAPCNAQTMGIQRPHLRTRLLEGDGDGGKWKRLGRISQRDAMDQGGPVLSE